MCKRHKKICRLVRCISKIRRNIVRCIRLGKWATVRHVLKYNSCWFVAQCGTLWPTDQDIFRYLHRVWKFDCYFLKWDEWNIFLSPYLIMNLSNRHFQHCLIKKKKPKNILIYSLSLSKPHFFFPFLGSWSAHRYRTKSCIVGTYWLSTDLIQIFFTDKLVYIGTDLQL